MLVVKNLYVYYDSIEAAKGIDFKVETGYIASPIGSDGAGETSTLNALLNAVEQTGEISFLGYDIKRYLTHTLVQKGIASVSEGRRVFINLSVEENPKVGVYNNNENYEHLREQMYKLFPRLASKKHAMAGNSSGGEARMLAISRALMSEPKLLMFDEPPLGLASKIVGKAFDIIVRLKEEGITILLVEQNAYSALKIGDYVYVLENGLIVMQDEARKLIGDDNIRKKYLGL